MFTTTKFSTWDLPSTIQSAIDGLGWEFATEVQRDTVPLARRGRDVIGQARTGPGNTWSLGKGSEHCAPKGLADVRRTSRV